MSTSPSTHRSTTDATNASPLSLCIPRVFKNITRDRIARCFALALGVSEREPSFINRIDMVARTDKNGQDYWRVFIHLSHYPTTSEGASVEGMISSGETVTIVYDEPWFWKVSMSRLSKPNQQTDGGRQRPRPYLACESAKTKSSPKSSAKSSPKSSPKSSERKQRPTRLAISSVRPGGGTTRLSNAETDDASAAAAEPYCEP